MEETSVASNFGLFQGLPAVNLVHSYSLLLSGDVFPRWIHLSEVQCHQRFCFRTALGVVNEVNSTWSFSPSSVGRKVQN